MILSRGRSPSWIGLARHREGAGDHRLRGDDGGKRRQDDQRQRPQSGAIRKNGLSIAVGIVEQQRALTEIVQQQRRLDEAEPGEADRQLAEMAHVGVERLGAGGGQEHRSQGKKPRSGG